VLIGDNVVLKCQVVKGKLGMYTRVVPGRESMCAFVNLALCHLLHLNPYYLPERSHSDYCVPKCRWY